MIKDPVYPPHTSVLPSDSSEMNFYIVPSGLYQTQQKMKGSAKSRGNRRYSRGSQNSRKSSDTRSLVSDSIELRHLLESSRVLSLKAMQEMPEVDSNKDMATHDHETSMITCPPKAGESEQISSDTKKPKKINDAGSQIHQQYLQVPSASLILSPTCGGIIIKPSKFDGTEGHKEVITDEPAVNKIPNFDLISSLSGLNSETYIRRHFLTPMFQILRYKNYLELIESQHEADAVTYAEVRNQSFGKFINKLSTDQGETLGKVGNDADLYRHEGILACELFKCRQFLRKLLSSETGFLGENIVQYLPEELIQANFTNYVRYLLSLPLTLPDFCEKLDSITSSHYKFKSSLQELKDSLNTIAQDGLGNEALVLPGADVIVQAITKVLYEYMLLEQYHIDVLAKLGQNSLVDRRIVRLLFNLFSLNMKLDNTESLKILNFNIFFSAQYSWYLALTIPFVRIFESNVFAKEEEDFKQYDELMRRLDLELHRTFFKNLEFDSFEDFNKMSKEDLIKLRNSLENNTTADLSTNEPGLHQSRHKPDNFEYLPQSIFKIRSETFHVIQSRDLYLQLNHANYKSIIREFHRILKKGGILELPIHIPKYSPNSDTLMGNFPTSAHGRTYKHDDQLLEDFLNVLVEELNNVFGTKNVMLGTSLISGDSKMNAFVSDHTLLRLHDIYEKLETFVSNYREHDVKSAENGTYFFYIRSEKI